MNEKELTHIDLFSGIGGFSLAGEWAGFRTIAFCEKEGFCQKVLKARFGAVIADSKSSGWSTRSRKGQSGGRDSIPLIPEIRDFDGTKWRGATLLTGGFPCQPFSVAGQRRGKEDDRHLWGEMFRIIKEAKPRWVLAENVTGIVKLALGEVLFDLESIGYDFPRDHEGTPIVPVIPACGLNAPHRRYRVWIIGYSTDDGGQKLCGNMEKAERPKSQARHQSSEESLNPNSHASDSERERLEGTISKGETRPERCSTEHPDGNRQNSWQEDWYEVATRFCRVDDGVPDRVHRLKALGNAIVPQIAYEILKNIAWIENEKVAD